MSHKDTDALKERIRNARANGKHKRKSHRATRLSLSEKQELCEKLVFAETALQDAILTRDAVIWQAHKAGLPVALMAESLNVSEAAMYERIKVLRKTLGIAKK